MLTNRKGILVVGGAGFVGSHMILTLRRAGYEPIVLDNLSKGHREAVKDVELIVGDMADAALLQDIFAKYPIGAVMQFAGFIEVGESIKSPGKYYQNNVMGTLNLLDVMLKNNVRQFIFSSTAAVYGAPQSRNINEAHPCKPINPYGRSKLMVEEILKDFAVSDQLNYMVLRYFNAAGADPEGRLFEHHEPETHLIPLVLQVAAGMRQHITVYGDHHATPDGTCIRDYVHVTDLCNAHLLALNALNKGKKHTTYNLGVGQGYSVLQVIHAVERVTGKKILVSMGRPRAGDPAVLVADASLAKEELHWVPKYPDLDSMILHAWKGFQK